MKSILFFVFSCLWLQGGQVSVAWDPNSESDLAGYRVHYGTSSGEYSVVIDVGNVTSYTIKGLEMGVAYFSALTAYNTSDLESGYSNEISFEASPSPPEPPRGFRVTLELQSSTDLKHWGTVATFKPRVREEEFFRFVVRREP